jgi:hypothetical protein
LSTIVNGSGDWRAVQRQRKHLEARRLLDAEIERSGLKEQWVERDARAREQKAEDGMSLKLEGAGSLGRFMREQQGF